MLHPPDVSDLAAAERRLRPVAVQTPIVRCSSLNDIAGTDVVVKAESLQRTGSFKFRGAYNAVFHAAAAGAPGVVSYSSGNHAGALARAAAMSGLHATVLMPHDAPTAKVAAAEGYGAEVQRYDRYRDDRVTLATALAASLGYELVPSADSRLVIAGAATVTRELVRQVGPVDCLVIPVGGGGLLAGAVLALSEAHPTTRIVAVEPEASADLGLSLAQGRHASVEVGQTIADGLQLSSIAPLAWEMVRDRVEAITVSDADIVEALEFCTERLKLVAEPSAVAGVAAIITGTVRSSGRVATVITGGNVGISRYVGLLDAKA